jgi:hypothetical protein
VKSGKTQPYCSHAVTALGAQAQTDRRLGGTARTRRLTQQDIDKIHGFESAIATAKIGKAQRRLLKRSHACQTGPGGLGCKTE